MTASRSNSVPLQADNGSFGMCFAAQLGTGVARFDGNEYFCSAKKEHAIRQTPDSKPFAN